MTISLRQLRRDATQLGIRLAISATAALPLGAQRAGVRSLVWLAGCVPMLRRKVRENMVLALGDHVPSSAERQFFRHAAWSMSGALVTFHHGIAATKIAQEIQFDDTIRVLDDAIAEGRGVILTSPHWSGHELIAAVMNLRNKSKSPMVMLVRPAATPERTARKKKWYEALGAETVLRPSETSTLKEAVAYLKVLKRGKILAITPDLLASTEEGVDVTIFGRQARLHAGAFVLAIASGAPMIRPSGYWRGDTAMVTFERAPTPAGTDRDAATRAALQEWCNWFEVRLKEHPENWLFWLDKRWSRFLRATPRTSDAT